MSHTFLEKKEKINIKMISLLLAILIVYQPILNALNRVTNLHFANTPYDTLAFYFSLAILVLYTLPAIVRRSYRIIFISLWIFVVLCLLSILIYPENQIQITNYIKKTFPFVFPYFFVGFALKDYEILFKYLKWMFSMAIISGLLEYIIVISTAQVIYSDNMSFAYNLLPSVIFAFYFAFRHRKIFYYILAILGFLLLVVAGTRGPLLCLIFYICIYLLTHFKSKKVMITMIILSVSILWLTSNNIVNVFLIWLSKTFNNLGIPTRIIDFILLGNYFDLHVRDNLMNHVVTAITERPLLGYGIFGDRSVLSEGLSIGAYVHNIVLEFYCHFGIVMGSIFLILIGYLIIISYVKNKNYIKGELLLTIIPLAIIKLLMSSSYIEEPYFFLMLGICIRSVILHKEKLA